ncbi:hypothetical protein LTR09_010034 [Extremus antarcticus]|uniref:Glycosyl hydrolase family 31 C-terminal domain-containing protein n=1 Tax=Extremus antarcticus TaxID=702011 RepID=A0AAJ0DEJ2_9PEZI|nr:hypothetical protein LTR09_010034 [Extremus antarcticus]
MRDLLQLRHRLVPYIYSMSYDTSSSICLPLVQPLYWEFPAQQSAYKFPTQFYFGSSLIVAPILQPRNPNTNLAKTKAWIPPCRHVDVLTGVVYDGDQEIDMYRPLDQLPLLAAEGSIIPLDAEHVPLNGCPNPQAFEVLVVIGRDARFEILENTQDDENSQATDGSQRSIPIDYDQAAGRLQVPGTGRAWTFRFLSTNIDSLAIRVLTDGKQSNKAECTTESTNGVPTTVVKVPTISNPESAIVIELGPDPHFAITDHTQHIRDLILDFQISNILKNDIWEIIQAKQPVSTKMARLISLGLDKDWFGPIAELLQADGRRILE